MGNTVEAALVLRLHDLVVAGIISKHMGGLCMCTRPAMWPVTITMVIALIAAGSPAASPDSSTFGRLALVVGNNQYKHLTPLANAVSDAKALHDALRKLGFEVTLLVDASKRDIDRQVGILVEQLRGNNVGLFFFAGHGIRVQQKNYLLGVDAEIAIERDVRREGLDADTILAELQSSGNPTNFVILDACRDNSLPRSRSATRGLAPMEAPPGSRGFLIAFSAGAGEKAEDGPPGRNSIYTEELLKHIQRPRISAKAVFDDTAEAVARRTRGQQNPWISKSPIGEFYFKEGRIEHERVELPTTDPNLPCLTTWSTIKDSKNLGDFEWFLQRFPVCAVTGLARKKREELLKDSSATFAPPSQLPGKPQEVPKLPSTPDPVKTSPAPITPPAPNPPRIGAAPIPSSLPAPTTTTALPIATTNGQFDGHWQGMMNRTDGHHDPQLQNLCRTSTIDLTVNEGKVRQGRITMDNRNSYELGVGAYGRVEIDGDISREGLNNGVKVQLFDNLGANFINFVFRSPIPDERVIEGTWGDQLNRCGGSFTLRRVVG